MRPRALHPTELGLDKKHSSCVDWDGARALSPTEPDLDKAYSSRADGGGADVIQRPRPESATSDVDVIQRPQPESATSDVEWPLLELAPTTVDYCQEAWPTDPPEPHGPIHHRTILR